MNSAQDFENAIVTHWLELNPPPTQHTPAAAAADWIACQFLKCWRLISDEYYRLPLHNYWQLYGDEGPSRAWLDAARRVYEKTQLDGDKI